MGQIKNIKLHIVTDIKIIGSILSYTNYKDQKMYGLKLLPFLSSIHHVLSIIVVDRGADGQDVFTRNTSIPCRDLKAHQETPSTCRCDFGGRTFGGNEPPCTSFPQCDMWDTSRPPHDGAGVALIRRNVTLRPLRSVGFGCDIVGVKLWNVLSYLSEVGEWVDVTEFALDYFNVVGSRRRGFDLRVEIPFEAWQGQLVRVSLSCESKENVVLEKQGCVVMKVKGRVIYPFITTKLNPNPTNPTIPSCFADDTCEENDGALDDGGSGGIIAGIVVAFIVLTIGVVLVRVCRHKFPCWDHLPPSTSTDENGVTDPSRRKSTTSDYEELLLTSDTNTDDNNTNNGGTNNVITNDDEYNVPTHGVGNDDGETIGVYYSTIDTLPHQYEPPQQQTNSNKLKQVSTSSNEYEHLRTEGNDSVYGDLNMTNGEGSEHSGSVSSPVYHEVEAD